MQTPEDRFYNPARINGWFAVSAVLVLATTVAAVLADHYDREWKGYQQAFHELERKRSEELLALRTAAPGSLPAGAAAIRDRLLQRKVVEGVDAAEAAKQDAAFFEENLAAVKDDPDFPAGAVLAARAYEAEAAAAQDAGMLAKRAEIEAARDRAEDARFKAEKEQRELQALVDELKFRMDHARAQGHDVEAGIAEKEWTEAVGREKQAHAAMDGFALEKTRRIQELRALWTPVSRRLDRARRLDEAAGLAGAEKKLGSFVVKGLRDAPLLDQFAPVTKIEQKVFPDLTVDYNFAQIGRVDRCITCHTGIDKIRVDPETGAVTPVFTAANTPEKVFRTHPRPELFVGSTSKHSADKVGCTVCHDGLGWGLSFNDAYHMPGTPEQEKEWEEKYHWHRGHSWDFPMLPLKHIEASCFKCHKDQAQLSPEDKFAKEIPAAPKWNRGLRIVERQGCFGCHKIDGFAVPGLDKWLGEIADEDRRGYALATAVRKPGPGLRRIASKWASREAAHRWIWHPQALRPTTNMPRFFGQPNNSGNDEVTGKNYDLITRTEVWGIVEYLWSASEPWKPTAPAAKGDAARGKRLFAGLDEDGKPTTVGCVGCHTTKDFPNPVEGGPPNDFGPELSTVGSKTSVEWLYTWLKNPSHVWAGTRMPSLRLSDQEAADLAAYLASLRNPEWEKDAPPPPNAAMVEVLALEALRATAKDGDALTPEAAVAGASPEERLRIIGRRAIKRYACFGCHDIKDFENEERIGTELGGGEAWGSKDVDRLDFGLMEDPKSVSVYAEKWGAKLLPHRKPEWAWLKLKNPRVFDAGITKQPHEKLVMPNFHFSDDEADAVVTFLLSLQRGEIPASKRRLRDSRDVLAEKMKWIVRQYNCYGCHTVVREEAVAADGTRAARPKGGDIRAWLGDDKAHWPPTLGGEDAILPGDPKERKRVRHSWEEGKVGEGKKVQPAWLFSFLRAPEDPEDPAKNMLRFWMSTRMPTFPLSQQELNALVQGFAAQDRAPFPFEFRQADALTPAEQADAKDLFEKLQCSSCHPTKASIAAGKKPSGFAPDLGHAATRLRHEWVKLWLDDPGSVQKGTSMPAFWRPDEALEVPSGLPREYFGNDPHAQMRKLADYVFTLGKPAAEPGTR